MLNVQTVEIENNHIYSNFFTNLPARFKNENLLQEIIQRIGSNCKTIKIEYPIFDEDFISTYSNYYSQKHRLIDKTCIKIHFYLQDESYGGFIVLRPLGCYSKIRTKLHPTLFKDTKETFIMVNDFKVNILGEELSIKAFPAIGQDTEISVCAHAALWSVLRYFSSKYNYRKRLIADIANQVEEFGLRRTPFNGLSIYEIARVLEKNEFTPIMVAKIKDKEIEFINELYSYVKSGLPVIASINQNHALTIVGHGELDLSLLSQKTEKLIFESELVKSFIAIDDNHLPYKQILKIDPSNNYHTYSNIDSFIVPLADKMFLTAKMVRERIKPFFNLRTSILNLSETNIVRIFLTSSNSYKKIVRSNFLNNDQLKNLILENEMPKFIWVVEISSIDDHQQNKVSATVIVDPTAGQYDPEPWILLHDNSKFTFYDIFESKFKSIELENFISYDMYENNLEKF